MTDLYIATPTQADYDALMRLAEATGFEWISGKKPTVLDLYEEYVEDGEQVIHFIVESKELMQCDRKYFENEGQVIETIPNLAKIKEILKISRENRDAFNMKHQLPPHYKSARNLYVICDEYSGTYTTKENEIYEALAVEYKPQESEEVMPEKVKLPKTIINVLDNEIKQATMRLNVAQPFTTIAAILNEMNKKTFDSDLFWWINLPANQWKLIDALRYGYEAEAEQLYYVDFGGDSRYRFLNLDTRSDEIKIDNKNQCTNYKVKFTMPEIIAIDPRYKAFAVPVEEVDGDMNKED
ncbi:DUF1642 domain-containing protein [Latilactobacillus sakei]